MISKATWPVNKNQIILLNYAVAFYDKFTPNYSLPDNLYNLSYWVCLVINAGVKLRAKCELVIAEDDRNSKYNDINTNWEVLS